MHREIEIEEALDLSNPCFVDVRSPQEYELDTIPGAVNVPLLDNEERHRVGLVYAEKGPAEARKLGLSLVAPKLPILLEQLEDAKGEQLVLFCWRGGDRSKAVASILDIMHIPCFRLKGGYKAYRQYINKMLHQSELPQQFVVLYGLTGTGKTEIIRELGQRGYPILDLEALAQHRGSVFGAVGLPQQPSQKKFESLIWSRIKHCKNSRLLIVEGESKKIGKLYLPDSLYNGMQAGFKILVTDSISQRVRRLIKDYVDSGETNLSQVKTSLDYLTRRLGKQKVDYLQHLLSVKDLEQFTAILLEDYYDVLYGKSIEGPGQYDLIVDAGNFQSAVEKIEEFIQHLI
ncbi:MAG: tRNA 2-selenouridine(34) synthase MnmH [Clostridia bacterium]|nr:tRNA 2-selenouridine(34) synthase MnmH [Clostridia bacterium]